MAAAAGIAQLMVAVLYLVTARHSSPENYGQVVAAIALGLSAAGFFDFGTTGYWTREIARASLSPRRLSELVLSKLAIAAVGSLGWAAIGFFLQPASYWWAAPAIAFVTICSQTAQTALRGLARSHVTAIVQLTDRTFASVLFFIGLWMSANPLSWLAVSLACGTVVGCVTAVALTPVEFRPQLGGFRFSVPWRRGWTYGIVGLAGSGQALDIPLLASVAGPAAAGVYGAVSRWTQPMGLLANAFASASIPFMARARNTTEALQHASKASWMLLVAITVCIVAAIGSPAFVQLLLGESYSSAAPVLTLLALGTIPAILNQPCSALLQSQGSDRYVAIVTIFAVAAQLLLIALLGASMGSIGGAIAYALLQTINFVLLGGAVIRALAHKSEHGGQA